MNSPDALIKLKQAFGTDELAWLRRRLRKQIERDGKLGERLLVDSPTTAERRSIERLLGRPGEFGKHISIRLSDLHSILAPLGAVDLQSILEALDGPIISKKQHRANEQSRWESLRNEFESEFTNVGIDRHHLAALVESGALKRAAGEPDAARLLFQEVLQVLRTLRSASSDKYEICRAELAGRALGDSHALDAGSSPLMVIKHLHELAGSDDYTFWSTLGVICDETSSTVLTLNLKFASGDLAPALNAFAAVGEPCRVTLKTLGRDLTSDPSQIYVCENPAILHAASTRLGTCAKPIICTEGQPSMACQKLLGLFSSNSSRLYYHGDFDWGGIKIANFVFRQFQNVLPWRFNAADYQQLTGGFVLKGSPVEAVWDTELCMIMKERSRGFHEEMILNTLLEDLGKDY